MLAHLLIVILGFAVALCQAAYSSQQPYPEKFKYWGCATVDAAGFSNPVPLPNGVLTPEMCQAACINHLFAAVSPTACRCGDDPNAIKSINEGFCNNPCSEDPYSPMCGGGCSEGESDISNLFVVQAAVIQATGTQTELGDPDNQPAPATDFFTVTSSVVLVASAALPWQTSLASTGQGQVPPSLPVTVQQPPESPLPPSAFVPIDPPTTSPGELLDSASTSTVQVPTSLTWVEDEPPTTPVTDPESLSDGSGIMSEFQAESPTSETLVTETGSMPTPSPIVDEVGVSEANQFEIPLLVKLSELLLIAVMLV